MKKYYLTIAVMAIFAIGFAASDEESTESSSTTSNEQIEKQKPAPKPDFLGTYSIKDMTGNVYEFELNEDRTVNIYSHPNNPEYRKLWITAKWKDERGTGYGAQIQYDQYHIPNFVFQYGEKASICAYLLDGYYYPDFFTADDRDEYYRLQATKIK